MVLLHYSTSELVDNDQRTLGVTLDNEVLASCRDLVAHLHLELATQRDLLVEVRYAVLA